MARGEEEEYVTRTGTHRWCRAIIAARAESSLVDERRLVGDIGPRFSDDRFRFPATRCASSFLSAPLRVVYTRRQARADHATRISHDIVIRARMHVRTHIAKGSGSAHAVSVSLSRRVRNLSSSSATLLARWLDR